MVYQKKVVFTKFNEIYLDLLQTMKTNSGNNKDFDSFYKQNLFIKKANLKMFIRVWHSHITSIYKKEIMDGNIDFFLCKNYEKDISENGEFSKTYSIQSYIQQFKQMYDSLDKSLMHDIFEKIQSLTLLSDLYYSLK